MYSFILNQWMCKTFRIIPIGSLEYEPKPETDGITRRNAYYIRVFLPQGGGGKILIPFFCGGVAEGLFYWVFFFSFQSTSIYVAIKENEHGQ